MLTQRKNGQGHSQFTEEMQKAKKLNFYSIRLSKRNGIIIFGVNIKKTDLGVSLVQQF